MIPIQSHNIDAANEAVLRTHITNLEHANAQLLTELVKLRQQLQHRSIQSHSLPDTGHEPSRISPVQEEITALERVALELSADENRYWSIIEDQTELVCRWVPDGSFTFVNNAYCLYVGKTRAELLHYHFLDFMPNDEHEQFISHIESLSHTNPVTTVEHRIVATDGEVRWHQWTHRLISGDHHHIVEYQSVGRDITDLKCTEAALRKERARLAERTAELSRTNADLARAVRTKDEFLANMSHELRTPLNAILGLTEALQEEVYGMLTDKQRGSLQSIEESGRHLLTLINDILDLAKIEAGAIELQLTQMQVRAVCQSSLRLVKQIAHKKRIRIHEWIDPDVCTMLADDRRIKQILVNLLSNAVKFTPEGGQIGLEVIGDTERQIVNFIVWDTGIGIAPEHQQRLFQPFVQIDNSLSRQHDGTGLGLGLVARLTELHGGSVSLTSEVQQGSRFSISLPWIREATPDEDSSCNAHTWLCAPLATALVVEDSPAAADQVTRYLHELGIAATTVAHGADAVSRAQTVQPDVIILDILLPDTSGWDILTTLKANPHTQHIAVIITSVIDEPATGHGHALGAAAYLVKPISRQQMFAAIHALFPHTSVTPTATPREDIPTIDQTLQPLILLAEDNEASIRMLSEYLEIKGYRIVVARNGIEAMEQVQHEFPALIVMDVQMPRMDGLQAIQHLRNDLRLATTPIIALTALTMPGDCERCLEAGANAYLSKPVRLKELHQIIDELLGSTQTE